eukprot:jgi/Mesvir1/20641/Mv25508-RA.1
MSKFLTITLHEAALGELGLLAEVERLLLELRCCDSGGGEGGVLLKHVRPGRDGRSIASHAAGAGLAAMSFTARAVRRAVFCRTSMAMALSLRCWSMSRSWAVMESVDRGGGGSREVEARRVAVAVGMVGSSASSQRATHSCHIDLQRGASRAVRWLRGGGGGGWIRSRAGMGFQRSAEAR